jgi:citrate synthase
MTTYMTSAEAAARLGVSRQTLYAYVSRGLLRAEPGATHRDRQYLAIDVERLAIERARARKPREVARATLSWGLPVLESAITLIEDEQLYYRGQDAIALAGSASVEAVAGLLWQVPQALAFGAVPPVWPDVMPALLAQYGDRRAEEGVLPLFTVATDDAHTAQMPDLTADPIIEGCGALVRLMAACLLGTVPDARPVHEQCAHAWRLDPTGAELVRMALVLCADHELNASGFTARCIASTGASVRASLVGGLAALTGGFHGATTRRDEAMWDEIDQQPDDPEHVGRVLRAQLATGNAIPGFGHHLYPSGDPRARALLAHVLPFHPKWTTLIERVFALSGQRPSVDFALVAVRRHLGLPMGAAFGLFALGRSVGWIAHALEQRANQSLIRPRAAYVGVRPGPGAR